MKNKKIYLVIAIIICFTFCMPCMVFADTTTADLNTIYDNPWGDADLQNKTGQILGLIQVIGYVSAVVMAIIIGIKYVIAMSTPEAKADVKKTLIPYAIGCLILTAGSIIVSVVALFSHEYVKYVS